MVLSKRVNKAQDIMLDGYMDYVMDFCEAKGLRGSHRPYWR